MDWNKPFFFAKLLIELILLYLFLLKSVLLSIKQSKENLSKMTKQVRELLKTSILFGKISCKAKIDLFSTYIQLITHFKNVSSFNNESKLKELSTANMCKIFNPSCHWKSKDLFGIPFEFYFLFQIYRIKWVLF